MRQIERIPGKPSGHVSKIAILRRCEIRKKCATARKIEDDFATFKALERKGGFLMRKARTQEWDQD